MLTNGTPSFYFINPKGFINVFLALTSFPKTNYNAIFCISCKFQKPLQTINTSEQILKFSLYGIFMVEELTKEETLKFLRHLSVRPNLQNSIRTNTWNVYNKCMLWKHVMFYFLVWRPNTSITYKPTMN